MGEDSKHVDEVISKVEKIATAGFIFVLRTRFVDTHKNIIDRFPPEWRELYERGNYYLGDPVFLWVVMNQGHIRWSEIKVSDYRNILKKAAPFGLKYGVVAASNENGEYSMLSAARSDREFTDDEMEQCARYLDEAVKLTPRKIQLKESELNILKSLADGSTLAEISRNTGVPISTVKLRVQRARIALNAKTTTEAVTSAIRRALF